MRILVVDHAPIAIRNVQRLLQSRGMEVVATASDGDTAVAAAVAHQPDICLLDVDLPGIDGIRVTEMITAQVPTTRVIVMGLDDDGFSRALAKRAGAAEYLIKPFSGDELLQTIQHLPPVVDALAQPHFTAESGGMLGAGLSGPAQGHIVVAIVAGKGGVGTSVLAANLGILVARESGRKVAVVDMDQQRGDLGALLRTTPITHLGDIAGRQAGQANVADALVDTPFGIKALLPAPAGKPAAELTADHVENVLYWLRGNFDLVIVDLPTRLDEAAATALRLADRTILISGMSHLSVEASRGMLASVRAAGVAVAPLLLLNRVEANSDYTKGAIEDLLGMEVAVQLPYDPVVISTSINRGTPFAVGNPSAQASRRLRELAGMLVGMPAINDEATPPPITEFKDDDRKKGKKKGLFGFARAQ